MIEQTLRKLGLNDRETKVYLAIAEHGKIAPTDLSTATKINRTTVYSIAKQLIKRGIIAEDVGSRPRLLIARPPEDLDILIRRQEHELDEKRYILQDAIKELKALTNTTAYSIPKIVFIEEDGIRDYLFKQTPAWNKSISENGSSSWGFQDPSFVAHFQEWIDWYWQQPSAEAITLKLITSQTDIEEEMKERHYERRHINFWQQAHDFTASTWVMGDYVVLIKTNEHPHYLVDIYDKTLAHNLRQVFKGIWSTT